MKKIYLLVALSSLLLVGLQAQTFEEKNGSLVFEAEDLDLKDGWKKQTRVSGFKGSGYINWTGEDQFRTPDKGILSAKIKINTPGKYLFKWISKVGKGDEKTEHNDSWLKFPDASAFYAEKPGSKIYPIGSGKTPNPAGAGGKGFFKVYINGTLDWTNRASTSDKDGHAIFVEFRNKGTYTIQIGARSADHLVDRITMQVEKRFGEEDKVLEGRVAVVADGNYRDSDDIAGTPVSLAILKAFGKNKKLVHYSHSCDLKPGDRDPGGKFREVQMQESCDGTASRWGGFDHIKFYNCQTEQDATINDLRDKINASSENNPLWLIEAGEPDIIWEAVNKAQRAKRKYLYIVTHHPANDRGDFHDLSDVMALGIPDDNLKRIPDQNVLLKKPLRTWHWARDHKDSRVRWLWDRGFRAQEDDQNYRSIRGDMDPSDAGMIYYWCTLADGGDENCDVPKLRELFNGYIDNDNNNEPDFTPPAGYTLTSDEGDKVNVNGTKDVAFGSNGKFIYLFNQTGDVDCNRSAFGSDPVPGVKKKCYIRNSADYTPPRTYVVSVDQDNIIKADGEQDIAFGANGNFEFLRNQTGDVKCDEETFGSDPAKGYPKKCFVRPSADFTPPPGYTLEANERENININEASDVAFGVNGKFIYLTNQNSNVKCDANTFGSDPEVGYVKKCFIRKAIITSIDGSVDESELAVFPNPSIDGIYHLSEAVSWNVFTIDGQIILSGSEQTVDLTNQSGGVYILKTSRNTIRLIHE